MYDEVDFSDRPILQGECTWGADSLDAVTPYLAKASEYFECGAGPFDLNEMPKWQDRRIAEGFVEGDVLDSRLERWSMPTRFGPRYQEELSALPNIELLFGVEARDFSEPNEDGSIECLELRDTATGEIRSVRAASFVLAAGAQESTRILLRNRAGF